MPSLRGRLLVSLGAVYVPPGPTYINRPAGLSYSPPEASAVYKQATDIPAGALRLSAYGSFAAAVTACRAAGKAMIVDTNATLGDTDLAQLNVPLYDEGGRTLTYGGSALVSTTKAMMYAYDGDLICRGVTFSGFGLVFGICVGSVNAYAYHTASAFGFNRVRPTGDGSGVGTEVNTTTYPKTLGGQGPSVNLADSTFINCENAFVAQSDTLWFDIIMDRVVGIGTYGLLDTLVTVGCDIQAYNADWRDCTGARELPSNNCHGMHTGFKVGVELSPHCLTRACRVIIENCNFSDVNDPKTATTNDVNASVGVDFRNLLAANITNPTDKETAFCDVRVGYCTFANLTATNGAEDCNAFYAKTHGLVFEGNHVSNCGAKDRSAATGDGTGVGDGSEATGVLIKDPNTSYATVISAGHTPFIAVRKNVFEDMPSNGAVSSGPQFVIKTSDCDPIAAYIGENYFLRCNTITPGGTFGLIRTHGKHGQLEIWGNVGVECNLVDNSFIYMNSFTLAAGATCNVLDNILARGGSVDYTAERVMIFPDSSTTVTASGNELRGSAATWPMAKKTLTGGASSGVLPVPGPPLGELVAA
jgi:hypothetical protein